MSDKNSVHADYLDPDRAVFSKTAGGFLSLKIGRKKPYPRVNLYRSFPLSRPHDLISVRDAEDHEIALIESLQDFPASAIRLIEEELDRRYFAPVIRNLISLKEEFGYTYWDTQTDAGPCRFTVKSGENSVTPLGESTLLIVDVDGNRFEFPDFHKADAKSMKLIEAML